MKDAVARQNAEEAAASATAAVETAESVQEEMRELARKFYEWIPEFEKTATRVIADQMREQVAPLAKQLAELSRALGEISKRSSDGATKDDLKKLEIRVGKTEQALNRFKVALTA